MQTSLSNFPAARFTTPPSDAVRLSREHLFVVQTNLVSRNISSSVVGKICTVLNSAKSDCLLQVKKSTRRGSRSFFMKVDENQAWVVVRETLLEKGGTSKVMHASGLFFLKEAAGWRCATSFPLVKHTTKLENQNAILKATRRVTAAKLLTGAQHIAQVIFFGLFTGKAGIDKLLMVMPKYSGDFYTFQSLRTSSTCHEYNCYLFAYHLAVAMEEMKNKRIIHCDLIGENLLVDWDETTLALSRVDVADFDLCKIEPLSGVERQRISGVLTYLSPELLCRTFNLTEEFAALLGIQDPEELVGFANDTRNFGVLLFWAVYGFNHRSVVLADRIDDLRNAKKYREANDLIVEWWNEIKTLKVQQDQDPELIAEVDPLKKLVWKSMFIDPRKRPQPTETIDFLVPYVKALGINLEV